MSSKKDKFSIRDKFYMNLALNLAREKIGLTGSNPSVGCVIVKSNKIISIGQTSDNGRPHAEYNAIKNCNHNLKNSTMYVSLEPCSHRGKTPPCTDLIIKKKIKKLIYAIDDIDERSSKMAFTILKNKKIIVKKFLFKKKAKSIYKSYFLSRIKKIPYVVGKIAASKDNYIYTKSKIITNDQSKSVTHLLRYKNEGILISSKTLNIDNPKLNCRLFGLEGYSPSRFILDKNLKIKKSSFIVKSAKKIKTYIFYNKDKFRKKDFLLKSGIKILFSKLNYQNQLDLYFVLRKINSLGISNLLVEGGSILTLNFLKGKFFNEFFLFKSDTKLSKNGKIKISNIINKLNNTFKYKKKIQTYLGKNELINYY